VSHIAPPDVGGNYLQHTEENAIIFSKTMSPTFQPYFQHHEDDDATSFNAGLQQKEGDRGQPPRKKEEPELLYRVRERQWMYLGPIAATPLAHIGVTLYRSAVTPIQKQFVLGGIVVSTFLAVGMRLVLMVHAGYPGGPNLQMIEREHLVTKDEKYRMEHASTMEIIKSASQGFG